jgi:hypothetical protein
MVRLGIKSAEVVFNAVYKKLGLSPQISFHSLRQKKGGDKIECALDKIMEKEKRRPAVELQQAFFTRTSSLP